MLIVIDTLRGDRLGSTGYPTAHTPHLDALAGRGVLFANAVTTVPVTLPAVTSLITGLYPMHHGVRDNGYFALADDEVTLAEKFREKGWRTSAVVGSAVLARDRNLDQGFETYDDAFEDAYPIYDPSLEPLRESMVGNRRRADRVTDLALNRIAAMGDEPFFLFLHYFDVHMHYDPPPRFADMHDHPYDGEVSFVDDEIGRLLQTLKTRDDVMVAVVADHGESQMEHGEPQHGFLLYQSTLHIPVILAGPGIPEGIVREDPVSLVDLEPTISEMFELPEGGGERDGVALGWVDSPGGPRLLYAETLRTLISYEWSPLRALRRGDWKYIEAADDVDTGELYDVAADPGETAAVVDPDRSEEMSRALAAMVSDDDPEALFLRVRKRVDPERTELLASLGYVDGVEGEPHTPPAPRAHPRDALPGWVARQNATAFMRYGANILDRGHPRRALAVFDSVLVLTPDNSDAYYLRGLTHRELDETAAAIADFRAAIQREPEHVEALSELADLMVKRGERAEAHRFWRRVFEIDEQDTDALEFLSDWHLGRDEPDEALPFLRRLAALDPGRPEIRLGLGLAAQRAGMEEEALEALERYIEMEPEGSRSDVIRTWLQNAEPHDPEAP